MGVRADRWQAASHGRVLRGLSKGLGWSGYWQMVRIERWNYINFRFNAFRDREERLYDLKNDPSELKDLAESKENTKAHLQMRQQPQRWIEGTS